MTAEKQALNPATRWTVALLGVACIGITLGLFINNALQNARLLRSDPNLIAADPGMMAFATGRGAATFAERCASCHGADGRGRPAAGVPDLTDEDWLYGSGQVGEIERVVAYGIRSHNPKAWNLAVMPAFARQVPSATQPGLQPLAPGDIRDVVEFIASLKKSPAAALAPGDPDARRRGAEIFAGRGACYDCHAADGQGDTAIGAPNLTDSVWLDGDGSRDSVFNSIAYGLQGVCPGWTGRLSPSRIRAVSVYVYALSHASKKVTASSPSE